MLAPPPFLVAQQPYSDLGRLVAEVSRSHTDTPQPVELLWTRDLPIVETYIWQHTTFTADRPPCPPAGFEPAIRASARPKNYALDRAVTGTGGFLLRVNKYLTLMQYSVWTFTVMCVIKTNFHFSDTLYNCTSFHQNTTWRHERAGRIHYVPRCLRHFSISYLKITNSKNWFQST